MAAKKRANIKTDKEKEIAPDFDFFKVFEKHRKNIIVTVFTICIIVAAILFYMFSEEKAEGSAWHSLNTFMNTTANPDDVTETQIQEILNTTKGTSAEPWSIYYCASVYFSKKEYDNAQTLIRQLEDQFENHYIVKEKKLLENLKTLISKESEWIAKAGIAAESEPPATDQEQTGGS
jgi:hypothetical protein